MEMAKGPSARLEDYLEAIYPIMAEKKAVGVEDIPAASRSAGPLLGGRGAFPSPPFPRNAHTK
jgi:hypothetical protein